MEYETTPETMKPARLRSDSGVPWILGLYGLAGATFVVASHMAQWYGGVRSDLLIFPFAAVLGGIATFLAGMWAYRTRDGLATAMLGTWGSFWTAYGLLNLLVATGRAPRLRGINGSRVAALPRLALPPWQRAIPGAVLSLCSAASARRGR